MVHFTALVASSAALFSVAQAAPAAARHLRADANPPAGNAIAQAKRGLVASAEIVIGAHEHYTTTTSESSKSKTKTRKPHQADKKTSKHKQSKSTLRNVNKAVRQTSTTARPPCATPTPDALLSATVDATLSHPIRRSFNGTSLPASGLPGFVEVATLLSGSSLARAVAGLVSTASQANSSASAFELTTSTAQSTQFYLVEATVQTSLLDVVNVQLPVLNGATLEGEGWCVTFDVAPPSAVTLQTCGPKEGAGQAFAWDRGTGELRPLYEGVEGGAGVNRAEVVAANSSADAATVTATAATTADSAASTPATETSSSAAPTDTARANQADVAAQPSSDSDADGPAVKLYFVPASNYYQAPSFAASLTQANQADAAPEDVPSATTNSAPITTTTATPASTDSAAPLATVTVSASIGAASDAASMPAPAGPDSSPRQEYAEVSDTEEVTSSMTATEAATTISSDSETVEPTATPTATAARRARRTTRW